MHARPATPCPGRGYTQYGDCTHETRYNPPVTAAAGFTSVTVRACPSVVHGPAVWKQVSGLFKLALAAETGYLRGHIVTQNLMFAARMSPA
jgi:hypothetical protein